jgi:hypothetical protein
LEDGPVEVSAGRVWVRFLNRATEPEARVIRGTLEHEYNDSNMVGRMEMQMAREPEGWRVIEAVMISEGGTDRSDHRNYVIEALRKAGVRLAHVMHQTAYVYDLSDGSLELSANTEVLRFKTVAEAGDFLDRWLRAREDRSMYFGLPSGESMDWNIRWGLEKALSERGMRLHVVADLK